MYYRQGSMQQRKRYRNYPHVDVFRLYETEEVDCKIVTEYSPEEKECLQRRASNVV